MKIVFNRQGKKHVCSTCFRPFDWDENSWAYYGMWLYFSCKLRKRGFSAKNKHLAKNNFEFRKYFAIE